MGDPQPKNNVQIHFLSEICLNKLYENHFLIKVDSYVKFTALFPYERLRKRRRTTKSLSPFLVQSLGYELGRRHTRTFKILSDRNEVNVRENMDRSIRVFTTEPLDK